jgi:nucleotide-binding universal stress UspA family protein
LIKFAKDEVPGQPVVEVVRSDAVADEITAQAKECDLVVLGLQRLSRRRKVFGEVILRIAHDTEGAVLMIGSRG